MPKKEQIGTKQLSVLVILYVIGDMLLFLPSNATIYAKQDAWISALISLPIGVAVAWGIFAVSQKFRGLTMVEFNRLVLGKWAGGTVTLIYLMFLLMALTVQIREIGDFITAQMMTETPMRIINLLMVLIVIMAVRGGLETITRTSEVFFILFAVLFVALIVLLLPQSDPKKLEPFFGQGPFRITQGVLFFVSFPFCELVTFWMIFPSVKQSKHTLRDYLLGVFLAGLAIFSITLVSLLVLGHYLLTNQVYATYTLAKKINAGHFLERVEAILAINWILSTYFRSVVNTYAFTVGVAQLFNLRDFRVLTVPLGLFLFGFAFMITPNIIAFNAVNPYWVTWDFTLFPVIPAIVLFVHAIKQKYHRRN